jgi:hypothetical protein
VQHMRNPGHSGLHRGCIRQRGAQNFDCWMSDRPVVADGSDRPIGKPLLVEEGGQEIGSDLAGYSGNEQLHNDTPQSRRAGTPQKRHAGLSCSY